MSSQLCLSSFPLEFYRVEFSIPATGLKHRSELEGACNITMEYTLSMVRISLNWNVHEFSRSC